MIREKPPLLIIGDFLSESLGLRFVCEDLDVRLRERGWSVTAASRLVSRGPRLLDMLAATWLRRGRYSVALIDVYSGSAFVWAEAVAASLKALRCPYVLVLRSGTLPDFAEHRPRRVRQFLEAATAVTSPSTFLKEELAPYRGDIRVIPNGLDLDLYPERELASARPKLVWIRSFEQRYNPILALEVVAGLSAEYPDMELVMVGADRGDWSARETIEAAARAGLQDRVHVRGAVPNTEVPSIMSAGDIFLNTTNVDNAPKTVMEAMASGLCIVSTDAGGVPHMLQDNRDALLVPRADPGAMVVAVRRVLTEPALARRLSRAARAEAETFGWRRVIPEWEALLSAVASGRP